MAQRVDLAVDQEASLALLRTKGLSIKELDEKTKEDLRKLLEYLHNSRGLSLTDIAKLIGNKTSGYASWVCRELGVKVRPFEEARLKGIREKRRKYERKPFDGTDEGKAYLMGLRQGDLSVSRPWNGVVRVSTSTTHPAMANLFRQLFEPYGHVYQHPRYKKDTGTYEWNLSANLDASFDFLLMEKEACWEWVQRRKSTILFYLAGILDAEGSIGIWSNGKGTALQVVVYNTNIDLLRFVFSMISELGYKPLGPYLDKRKGTITSKYKIPRRKDYWKIALANFAEVQSLLGELPIRHPEKIERKKLALTLQIGESWGSVEPHIKRLRATFLAERDRFVREAEEIYAKRRSGSSRNQLLVPDVLSRTPV